MDVLYLTALLTVTFERKCTHMAMNTINMYTHSSEITLQDNNKYLIRRFRSCFLSCSINNLWKCYCLSQNIFIFMYTYRNISIAGHHKWNKVSISFVSVNIIREFQILKRRIYWFSISNSKALNGTFVLDLLHPYYINYRYWLKKLHLVFFEDT